MVRLKFLIFALLAIGLGLAHLYWLSGPLGSRAVEGAQAQAVSGTAEVVRTLETRRAIARALAMKLAASPELISAVKEWVSAEAPSAEGLAPVRAAAEAALPKDIPGVVIALDTPAGAWHLPAGGGAPSSDAAVLDVKALLQPEAATVVEAFGAPHAFASVPLLWNFVRIPGAEKLETQLTATLVVGVPLLPEGVLDSPASVSGAAALGLVKENTVVASGGQKALVDSAVSTLKAAQPVVQRGQVQALGPVKLPVLTTGKDFLGGQTPLVVGTRRELEGTPYEVIALVSTRPLMGTLADYQKNALFGLGGLLVLSLVWTALMGSGKRAATQAQPQSAESPVVGGVLETGSEAQAFAPPPSADSPPTHPGLENTGYAPLAEQAAAAEASQEFPFGPPPSAPEQAFAAQPPPSAPFEFPPAPEPQSFGAGPTPFDQPEPVTAPQPAAHLVSPAAPRAGAFVFEEIPTASYSLQQAADPMAAAAAAFDEPSETTRVAAIPRELLQASARPPTLEVPTVPMSRPAPPAPSVAPVPWGAPELIPLPGTAQPSTASTFMGNVSDGFSEEDYHFQEVFREFVLTRERCSEPADGLTYDKFVQKLRKNKEQLVAKYACRTVKFQVYVKEGKAALKATPVKD